MNRLPLARSTTVAETDPIVSVVIVTYNAAEYLPRAVYSVLGQEGVSLELIVVDNASTDHTRDFLATIHDPRLKVIANDSNGGPQAANVALPLLRGRYVARLDADDIALQLRLARQTAFLEPTRNSAAAGPPTRPWCRTIPSGQSSGLTGNPTW